MRQAAKDELRIDKGHPKAMSRYGTTSEQFMQKHYGPSGYVNLKEKNKMDTLFEVHMLNDAGKQKAKDIATAFDNCLMALTSETFGSLCPPSRELSIVKTKLEEACFFAKKAMANVKENQA